MGGFLLQIFLSLQTFPVITRRILIRRGDPYEQDCFACARNDENKNLYFVSVMIGLSVVMPILLL